MIMEKLDGEQNIEYAALGRKVCEQEHDLFLALGLTAAIRHRMTAPAPTC